MKLNTIIRAGLQMAVCAVAFSATEVWNSKDPSVWTTEDANVILNKSPWAKQIKVGGQQPMRRGMGRRGGMGYPGGGYPGGGYPGGGYPGGGGGYPGGGGGYPQGGGGGGGAPQMNAVVRWESAKPVQEAEARLKGGSNAPAENPADLRPGEAPPAQAAPQSGPKISGNPFANHYVITVVGLPAPGGRSRYNDDDNDSNSSRSNSNSNSNSGGLSRSARDQMMSTAQLIVKNGAVMSPDNIKLNPQSLDEIQFLFPKTTPLSLDDKEVTFRATIGKYKVENKFELKQMTRNKKLEVD